MRCVIILTLLCSLNTIVNSKKLNVACSLTVASCPTPFSGQGNVVALNFDDGQAHFQVKDRFDFPGGIDNACPVMESSVMADHSDNSTILSFTTEWGLVSVIDLITGKITKSVKGSSGDKYLFDGFTSMKIANDFKNLLGITPHVTEDGFCSDGCFRYGMQNIQTGIFSALSGNGPGGALPFKAGQSQTSYFDDHNNIFYVQGSYPLSPSARCNSDDTADCLLAINTKDGKLMSSTLIPENVVVYKYHTDNSTAQNVLAFVYGFEKICKHPYESYAFTRINLLSGKIVGKPVCMSKLITVHQKPEMGSFSSDGKYFVLANGDTEGSDFQLLVFNTETGEAVVNSDLKGLKKALHVSTEVPLMQVWGISASNNP
jgi:hypothetical protein